MNALLEKIERKIASTDKRIIIGISGHGASGKTTFSNKLIKRLGEKHVTYRTIKRDIPRF